MKINAYSERKIWRILSLSQFIVCKYAKIWTVHNILILISQLQHISTFNKLRSILGKYSCCFIKVNSIQFVFHNEKSITSVRHIFEEKAQIDIKYSKTWLFFFFGRPLAIVIEKGHKSQVALQCRVKFWSLLPYKMKSYECKTG